jgi:hypothetical protein
MKKKDLFSWQKKQYYDLSNITEEEIEKSRLILNADSEKMINFSKSGYPVFYFEDLFIDKNKETALALFRYIQLDLNDELYQKYINSDLFKIRLNEGDQRFTSLI